MGTFQLYSWPPEWGAGCAGNFKFYKNSWTRSFRWVPSWWTQWSAGRVIHPNSTWTFAQDLCGLCPVYLFIWLFMCLLCKDTKVNAFFVDISNASYWVLWATRGNYWTLGEFHRNSKFNVRWSEIYEDCDLWLASELGTVLWDWDLHQLPVFNVKNDLHCWISSYCLKNQRFGCWCWETPRRPVHHAHLLEQDTRNLIYFTNVLMWTVLATDWISLPVFLKHPCHLSLFFPFYF